MRTDSSGDWFCIDDYSPEPYRDGTEISPIVSEEQLAQLLRNYAQKEPRILIIANPNGGRAFVGIGGELAAVSYYPTQDRRVCVTARPKETYTKQIHDFRAVGEWTPFYAEYMMPFEKVIQIIIDLYRTGELPVWITWKQTGV
jgi:hypothetical protein